MHAASDPRGDPWQVDVAGTRRLVEAVDRDRLRHLVYVSIVGVDRIPYGYYRAKFAAEQVLLASGLPVTLLRVTQFHDFVDFLLDTARRGPVLPVPMGWRVQPVDVGEVAEHVTAVVAGAVPRGASSSSGGRRSSPRPTSPAPGPPPAPRGRTWWPRRCPGSWARRSGTARARAHAAARLAGTWPHRTPSTCTAVAVARPEPTAAAPARSRSGTDDLDSLSGNRRRSVGAVS